ncbi:hypothetical protein CPC08DRAFT_250616 [Agrocybe pediades]|nr:hypothetical protein CPC08DRAFT_250616 [Agrocybe pediades]
MINDSLPCLEAELDFCHSSTHYLLKTCILPDMGAPGTKVPLLLNVKISTIEARGPIDLLKSRYKYLIRIDNDEEKIAEKLVGSIVQEAGEFRIRWDVNKNILFALSSTVKLSVYGKGVLEHGLGGFEGSVVDLVDNDSYVDITKEGKITALKLRVAMALDANTHATDNVKDVMTKVDKQLAAMQTLSLPDSDNQSVKFVMGQILQSTKSIMDKIADVR